MVAEFLILQDSYSTNKFDIFITPQVQSYPAGGAATVIMTVKTRNFLQNPNQPLSFNCLISAKIRNCSARFTFPCTFKLPSHDTIASDADF